MTSQIIISSMRNNRLTIFSSTRKTFIGFENYFFFGSINKNPFHVSMHDVLQEFYYPALCTLGLVFGED